MIKEERAGEMMDGFVPYAILAATVILGGVFLYFQWAGGPLGFLAMPAAKIATLFLVVVVVGGFLRR